MREGNDLWIVYNEGLDTDRRDPVALLTDKRADDPRQIHPHVRALVTRLCYFQRTMRTLLYVLAVMMVMLAAPHALAQSAEARLETVRNYQRISDRLASSGQVTEDHIPALKAAGFEVVVNLAPARASANAREGFLVTQEGLAYIHIPVLWDAPSLRDLDLFFGVMEASADRKVYVHCFANMRASAFVYLYRTLVQGVPEDEARAVMHQIWDPMDEAPWAALIEQAQQRSRNH